MLNVDGALDRLQRDAQKSELEPANTSPSFFCFLSVVQVAVLYPLVHYLGDAFPVAALVRSSFFSFLGPCFPSFWHTFSLVPEYLPKLRTLHQEAGSSVLTSARRVARWNICSSQVAVSRTRREQLFCHCKCATSDCLCAIVPHSQRILGHQAPLILFRRCNGAALSAAPQCAL